MPTDAESGAATTERSSAVLGAANSDTAGAGPSSASPSLGNVFHRLYDGWSRDDTISELHSERLWSLYDQVAPLRSIWRPALTEGAAKDTLDAFAAVSLEVFAPLADPTSSDSGCGFTQWRMGRLGMVLNSARELHAAVNSTESSQVDIKRLLGDVRGSMYNLAVGDVVGRKVGDVWQALNRQGQAEGRLEDSVYDHPRLTGANVKGVNKFDLKRKGFRWYPDETVAPGLWAEMGAISQTAKALHDALRQLNDSKFSYSVTHLENEFASLASPWCELMLRDAASANESSKAAEEQVDPGSQ